MWAAGTELMGREEAMVAGWMSYYRSRRGWYKAHDGASGGNDAKIFELRCCKGECSSVYRRILIGGYGMPRAYGCGGVVAADAMCAVGQWMRMFLNSEKNKERSVRQRRNKGGQEEEDVSNGGLIWVLHLNRG